MVDGDDHRHRRINPADLGTTVATGLEPGLMVADGAGAMRAQAVHAYDPQQQHEQEAGQDPACGSAERTRYRSETHRLYPMRRSVGPCAAGDRSAGDSASDGSPG